MNGTMIYMHENDNPQSTHICISLIPIVIVTITILKFTALDGQKLFYFYCTMEFDSDDLRIFDEPSTLSLSRWNL